MSKSKREIYLNNQYKKWRREQLKAGRRVDFCTDKMNDALDAMEAEGF